MVLAGGTGTAWHICKTIKEYYRSIYLIVCDTNPKHLVHSSVFANEFITIPPISSSGYENFMLNLFTEHHITILVPLIDYDLKLFSRDNKKLVAENIFSTAPLNSTFDTLANKINMKEYLKSIDIATPEIFKADSIEPEKEYYIKDIVGFGSRGAYSALGSTLNLIENNKLIQELCFKPEVSADVFVYKKRIFVLCRERIEVKAGVCTKARIFYDDVIRKIIEKIAHNIELPIVSCIQFMKNSNNEWSLTDFNLRPGAGTAMSAAVGFQCVRAALAIWLNNDEDVDSLLKYPIGTVYVIRTYQEIITNENNSI
jgi:hypothetical protein